MAGQAQVGALRVKLSMDVGEFDKNVSQSEKSLGRLNAGMKKTGETAKYAKTAIVAALAAAAAGVAWAIHSMLKDMDDLSKMSRSIGIPIEQLSGLKYAADLSGVSLEALAKGVKKLSLTMNEIASGDVKTPAARSIAALGVAVVDTSGQLRSANEVMADIATQFAGIKDGAGKTAIAMNVFGKSGADLISMLNEGGAGLRAMQVEAAQLGITLTTQTGKSAEAFNDNVLRLKMAFSGLINKIVTAMLPTLVTLTDSFVAFVKNSKSVDSIVSGLATTFKVIATVLTFASAQFSLMSNTAQYTVTRIKQLWEQLPVVFELAMAKIVNSAKLGFKAVVDYSSLALRSIGAAVDSLAGTDYGKRISESIAINPELMNTEGAAAKLEELNAKAKATFADYRASAIESTAGAIADITKLWTESAALQDKAAADTALRNAPAVQGMEAMAAAQKAANLELAVQNKLIQEGIALVKKDRSPQEILADKAKALDAAFAKNKISAEQLGEAMRRATMISINSYATMAGQIATNLAGAFKNVKAFAIASAIINTAESVTKTLATYGATPWGLALAASAAVAGAAQIATIMKTNKGSTGGNTAATASESAATAATATAGPSSGTLQVQGISAGQMFSGEVVRDLASRLLDYQRDGGKVVLA